MALNWMESGCWMKNTPFVCVLIRATSMQLLTVAISRWCLFAMVDLITLSHHQVSYAKLYIGFAALRPSSVEFNFTYSIIFSGFGCRSSLMLIR